MSKRDTIYLTNIDNLIDKIDKLNPSQINLDPKTLKLYDIVKKDQNF